MSYRYGCGYGIGAGPSRTPEIIWDASLDLLPLSTSANAATLRAALAAMGLTLTRASAATVQTSASEVVASGIGVDDPRVGIYGLVIEEARTNVVTQARGVVAGVGNWTAGASDTPSADYAAGPDGGGVADRHQIASGGFGCYYAAASDRVLTFSLWTRHATGSGTSVVAIEQAGPLATPDIRTLGTTWERVSITRLAGRYCVVQDGRNTYPGTTAGARDVVVDLAQVEEAKFSTEAILTTGAAATRAGDRLQLSQRVLATVVRGGRLCMEFDFVPKAATRAGYASAPIFFAHDSGNYAGFGNTIGAMQACVAGVAVNLSPSGIDWTAGQRVRVFIEIGAGTPKAWVKIDEAAAVYATHATVHAAFPTISALDVMNYLGILQFSAWIRRIRAWAPGRRPAWAV